MSWLFQFSNLQTSNLQIKEPQPVKTLLLQIYPNALAVSIFKSSNFKFSNGALYCYVVNALAGFGVAHFAAAASHSGFKAIHFGKALHFFVLRSNNKAFVN